MNIKEFSYRTAAGMIIVALLLTAFPLGFSPAQAASPGDVVINEIIQNPAAVGDDAGEWFELYNPTASDIDIDGWTIQDNDIDSHLIDNGGPLVIPAGGYLVLGNNIDMGTNGGAPVAYSYGSNWFLSNSADEVVLLDDTLTEIDRVEYDGGTVWPDPTGASMSLIDPALDNNVGANWCTATTPFGAGDLGTPGAGNDCVAPAVEVVINEIIQNPAAVGDDTGEWFELYNPTANEIDIDGWTIQDNDIDSHVIDNGGPLVIPAGGYLVLGNNDDTAANGGAPVAYSYGSNWFLSNSADEVVLLDDTLTEIDRVEYDGGTLWPDPTGASMSLIDPALDNNVGANWCTASTPFGAGDLGSPGAGNDCIAPAVEVVINEIIQNPDVVYDSAGEWFELFNPMDSPVNIEGWTIQDNDYDSHVILGSLVIPAGGYVVLGNNADTGTNGGAPVDYQYSGIALGNSGDEVVLLDAALTEIDRVEYDGGTQWPDPTGASMALIDPTLDNNVGGNWCAASTPFGAGDLGTPGAENDCVAPVVEVVINEIIQNPAAVYDSAGEWFELYNPTLADIDINGWTIQDNDYDSHLIDNGGPLVIPAGGYLVLGNNSNIDTNGGVNVDYSYGPGWYLSNGADEVVLLDVAMKEIDRVEYDGGPSFPDPTGASMSLIDPTLDNNVGAYWCTASTPFGDGDFGTPGTTNYCATCGEPATFIHTIQGDGFTSPEVGNIHIIEGVVVGDFQDITTELGGFFIQEEDTDVDGNPMSSEGLFVNDNGFGIDVNNGEVVRVWGVVHEYFDLTRLTGVNYLVVCEGNPPATAATITLPVASIDEWEYVEGMHVNIPHTLYATDNYDQGRYGEVDLSVDDRLYNPTNIVLPGAPANALQEENDRRRIQMDDGSNVQNPLPLPPYIGDDNTLRAGDTIPSLTGAVGYAYNDYEIHPTEDVSFTRVNGRSSTPDAAGGVLKIASFNVLNYFTTIDNSGPICGPSADMDCRGADTDEEFTRQRDKIISAITSMDADIIGLMELENHPTDDALFDLVNGLNDLVGAGTYAALGTGPIGTDAIKVAFIYKPSSAIPVGSYAILDSSVDPTFIDTRNRPALAQTFSDLTGNYIVTAAVNHLKSKGSSCEDIGDPDIGDGQGNCNLTRTAAATALVNWLATDPTTSGDPDFLIIGDLNAYAMEDPITAIKATGYTNLIESFMGAFAYSYVFYGQAGYLDHALANPNAAQQVIGTTVWHINGDEPSALNYNNYNQDDLYNPDMYRSSDHDPVIIDFCEVNSPEVDIWLNRDRLWPPDHKLKHVKADLSVFDQTDVTIELVSITSNEPDNGLGDGDQAEDIIIDDDYNFWLRAERSGIGGGRVYLITYMVTDACGNVTYATAEVTVPHNMSKRK